MKKLSAFLKRKPGMEILYNTPLPFCTPVALASLSRRLKYRVATPAIVPKSPVKAASRKVTKSVNPESQVQHTEELEEARSHSVGFLPKLLDVRVIRCR